MASYNKALFCNNNEPAIKSINVYRKSYVKLLWKAYYNVWCNKATLTYATGKNNSKYIWYLSTCLQSCTCNCIQFFLDLTCHHFSLNALPCIQPTGCCLYWRMLFIKYRKGIGKWVRKWRKIITIEYNIFKLTAHWMRKQVQLTISEHFCNFQSIILQFSQQM